MLSLKLALLVLALLALMAAADLAAVMGGVHKKRHKKRDGSAGHQGPKREHNKHHDADLGTHLHERKSCDESVFKFKVKGMDCDRAQKAVLGSIKRSERKTECIGAEPAIEVLQGCTAPVTKDRRVNRVRLLCDTATNTVCEHPTNG